MPSEHELNEDELRTLFPDSPPPTPNATSRAREADGEGRMPGRQPLEAVDEPSPPAPRDALASRRLHPELIAVCHALSTRFSQALKLAAHDRLAMERTDGEWLRWGEFLWTLGSDETIAVVDPLTVGNAFPHASHAEANASRSLKLVLHTRLVRAILERFLSGTGSASGESALTPHLDAGSHGDRPLTEIERRLASKTLAPVAAAWLGVEESDQLAASMGIASQLPRIANDPWVVMICFRLEIGPVVGRMRCVAPAAWVNALGLALKDSALKNSELKDSSLKDSANRVASRRPPLGRQPSTSDSSSCQSECLELSGCGKAGSEAASSELASSEAAGSEAAGSEAAGSEAAGSEAVVATAVLRRAGMFACAAGDRPRALSPELPGGASHSSAGELAGRNGVPASERWTVELAEQWLPAAALDDLRVGDLLRSDHPLDYPLLARAESGEGAVPVRIGMVDGECVARRVDR